MRKKKKLKVKLPSSKKVSTGMTEPPETVDVDSVFELSKLLAKEKREKNWKDIELQNKDIEIDSLKLKLQNPTYHQLGDRGNPWTPPVTHAIERELEPYYDFNSRAMQVEIQAMYSYWMNIVTCVGVFVATMLIWLMA